MSFLIILKDYLQIIKINYLDNMKTITINEFISFTDKEKKEFLSSKIVYLDEMSYDENIISYNGDSICEFLNTDNKKINKQELIQQFGSYELHRFLQKDSFFSRIKNIINKLFR